MNEAQITRTLEAYIMWLLGKIMFTENHVSTISKLYIRSEERRVGKECRL